MQLVLRIPEKPDEKHFNVAAIGADRLGAMVDGNGLKATQVKLLRHDTQVHQLPAALHVRLSSEISKRVKKGQHPEGVTLGSQQEVISKTEGSAVEFLKSPAVQSEIDLQISQQQGQGWAAEPLTVSLKQTTEKVYSVIEKCLKCTGIGTMPCRLCNGLGEMPCQVCAGNGMTSCPTCYGGGMFQKSDGSRAPCIKCNGTGRFMCLTCQGLRNLPCTTCQGLCKTPCLDCDQSGFWTNVHLTYFNAEISFALDKTQIPQDVMTVIDTIGVRPLVADGHAEAFRLPFEVRDNAGYIPVSAFFGIAAAEYTIEGKTCPAVVAGLRGRVVEIEPFLDPVIKPGINALVKLSKGPMATEALIATACKYRVLRDVIGSLTYQSKKTVYLKIVKEYPKVISDKYLRSCVKYADQALLSLGEGPRNKGLAAGSLLTLVLSGVYFAGGLRGPVAAALAGKNQILLGADLVVWVLGYGMTLVIIKLLAQKSLQTLLPQEVQTEKKGLPAAGKQGTLSLLTTFVVWALAAFAAADKPFWVLSVLKGVTGS